jgi:hypothetical protein
MTHDDWEKKMWRETCNYRKKDKRIIIPPRALKLCVEATAKYLSIQIPGKGKATYTKHFRSGVMVTDPVVLPQKRDNVQGEWVFVPADGKRGGSARVWKCYPTIEKWKGKATFYILDDTITEAIFEKFLREAGVLTGLGVYRPENGGEHGRFKVTKFVWKKK